jgi:hypothetical protein
MLPTKFQTLMNLLLIYFSVFYDRDLLSAVCQLDLFLLVMLGVE